MKKDLIIKIFFVLLLAFSIYLIISGITENNTSNNNNNNDDNTDGVLVQDIEVSTTNINLNVGEEYQIEVKIIPENATYKTLTWKSINPMIASVDDGKVTALSAGKTYIKVTSEKRQISKIINVTVNEKIIEVNEIKVNESNITLEVGDTKQIEYTVLPEDATNKKISYSTSDKNIVAFNQEGMLVAVNAGTATITLKSNNNVIKLMSLLLNKSCYYSF